MKRIILLSIIASLSLPGLAQKNVEASAEAQSFIIKLEGALEDKTLSLYNLMADVEVIGTTGNEIKITTEGYKGIPEKAKGLKPLSAAGPDNTEIGLNFKKEGNELRIGGTTKRPGGSFYRLEIPKKLNLVIVAMDVMNSGDIKVSNMQSEVEVTSFSGDMTFKDITGPIVASSRAGADIEVIFSSLSQQSPTSLYTIGGDIDITLPASSKGNFGFSSLDGDVYSDLDFVFEKTEEEVALAKKQAELTKIDKNRQGIVVLGYGTQESIIPVAPPTPTIASVKPNMKAKLGGGGVEVSLRTIGGNIYVRKSK